MKTLTQLGRKMQDVLYRQANECAWESGFMERERILTGSSFVRGLVSAWQADPDTSLAGLSQALGNAGTPLTRQAVNQRFTPQAAQFLREMVTRSLETLVTQQPVPASHLDQFSAVEVVDSSIITLPNSLSDIWHGSGGYGQQASVSALKLSVRWDVRGGQITHLDLSHGTDHDRRAPAHSDPVGEGSLQLRDLGYFKLDDLENIQQQGAHWLIKYQIGTHLYSSDGHRLDLLTWLPQTVGQWCDREVRVGANKQLPARLVAQRVPPTVVRQRHERIRETARQNQTQPSARSLALAKWTIYLTTVPTSQLSIEGLFILGRYRWQIELLFKLWKSKLHVDQWRTSNPDRILCEIYAKLIVAIVTHWLLLIGCWRNPRRSLVQAMPTIRGLAWQWSNSLHSLHLLLHMLRSLRRSLASLSMTSSQSDPRAFQLLETEYA